MTCSDVLRETMPNSLAPIVRTLSDRSSLSLARTSLFNFVALLALVFAAAAYSLVYLAHELDHSEQQESAFYTRKAVQSLEKSLRVTVKDYAFWSDAYKHLHMTVDSDWAYARGNVGATLYQDFGFQGLFVVDNDNRTVYSVIKGELQSIELSQWLDQPLTEIIEQARAGAENEHRSRRSSMYAAARHWWPPPRSRPAPDPHGRAPMAGRPRC